MWQWKFSGTYDKKWVEPSGAKATFAFLLLLSVMSMTLLHNSSKAGLSSLHTYSGVISELSPQKRVWNRLGYFSKIASQCSLSIWSIHLTPEQGHKNIFSPLCPKLFAVPYKSTPGLLYTDKQNSFVQCWKWFMLPSKAQATVDKKEDKVTTSIKWKWFGYFKSN